VEDFGLFHIAPKASRSRDWLAMSGREGFGMSPPPCLAGGERDQT
jgi:hypothetical protein